MKKISRFKNITATKLIFDQNSEKKIVEPATTADFSVHHKVENLKVLIEKANSSAKELNTEIDTIATEVASRWETMDPHLKLKYIAGLSRGKVEYKEVPVNYQDSVIVTRKKAPKKESDRQKYEYQFLPLETILSKKEVTPAQYEDGHFYGNSAVIKHEENLTYLTVSHVARHHASEEIKTPSFRYDMAFMPVPEKQKETAKKFSHPITQLTDAQLNGKIVTISGLDHSYKKDNTYENGKVTGRAFYINEDYGFGGALETTEVLQNPENFITWGKTTKKGCFIILINPENTDQHKKLPGISGSPVFYDNPNTTKKEIVGSFTALPPIKIEGKEYLGVLFNGPSIIKKAIED